MTPFEAMIQCTVQLTSTAREIEHVMATLAEQDRRFASLLVAVEADHRSGRSAIGRLAQLRAADAEIRKTVQQLSGLLTRANQLLESGGG